jgi:hypothetical protein
MNSEVYKTKVDRPDELLAGILGVAGCIKKRGDKLRRTARDIHTPQFWHQNQQLSFAGCVDQPSVRELRSVDCVSGQQTRSLWEKHQNLSVGNKAVFVRKASLYFCAGTLHMSGQPTATKLHHTFETIMQMETL